MDDTDMQLLESITKDDAFFKQMVDLVPPKFYFDRDTRDKLKEGALLQMETKLNDGGKKQKRPGSELSDKAKLKRAKFDPQQQKTVTQIQGEMETWNQKERPADNSKPRSIKKRKRKDSESTESKGSTGSSEGKQRKMQNSTPELKSSTETMEELRLKLEKKITNLRAKRQNLTKVDSVEKKKLKRRESKLKLKMRRKAEKQNLVKAEKQQANGLVSAKKQKAAPAKPVFNKEGKMVFSKFDFTEVTPDEKPSHQGKDYKKILQKVQKEKDRVEMLSVTEPQKAKTVKEKAVWKNVLQKAEGIKVKDDTELLKKAVKRKEKKKEKIHKNWDERKDKVKERMDRQQDKRKKNIKAKKQSRVDRKVTKAKKKGRIIPGF